MAHPGEKFYIGTTRFSNKTYNENKQWRIKHNWQGCIYGTNKKISHTIPSNALIYVLEMNNDTNTIEGIGLVRNYINAEYHTCIYKSDLNYNRYIYNSQYRIDKKHISSPKMINLLEHIIFTGSRHYKRGQGITTINWKNFDIFTIKIIKTFFQGLFKF
jgi:hypothetical protein